MGRSHINKIWVRSFDGELDCFLSKESKDHVELSGTKLIMVKANEKKLSVVDLESAEVAYRVAAAWNDDMIIPLGNPNGIIKPIHDSSLGFYILIAIRNYTVVMKDVKS